jgi:hypothetical protein
MKVTAAYTEPAPKKDNSKHPRAAIDEQLEKNYPGRNLEELDENLVSVVPGTPDTHEISVLRRLHKPSRMGGQKRDVKITTDNSVKVGK